MLSFSNHLANPLSNPKCVLTHVWGILTHVWGMFTLPITLHAFHASFMFVPFTWESSWLTHVWEAMLLTPFPPLAHVTIKGWSHMCEHLAPFDWSKTLIHVELTWPPPHRSWEILALHLEINLSRPLHLISYKRRALSSFSGIYHLPHCYAARFVRNHIPWAMKSSTLDDFVRFALVYFE